MFEKFKEIVRFIFRKFGYSVISEKNSIDLRSTLKLLRNMNEIQVIYDIGANNGKYGMKSFREIFRKSQIYAFEANPIHFPYPDNLYNAAFQVCLSDRDNLKLEFFMNNTTGDSLFRENTSHYEDVKPTIVKTRTLDSVCAELSVPEPDLVKIDVQGAELLVLQGAQRILKNTRFVVMELSLLEYNLDAPRMSEILTYLEKQSFYPIRILEQHLIDSIIVQIDFLFERRNTPLYHVL